MIIIFNVTYPDNIDPAAAKKILQLLPQPKNKPQLPKDVEEVQLEVFDGKFQRSVSNMEMSIYFWKELWWKYLFFPLISDWVLTVTAGEATWGGEKTQHTDDYEEEDVHPGMQGGPQCKQM